jgi:hypothetical protein
MSDDPQFPGAHGELVTPERRPTKWWYDWFRKVNTRITAAQTTADAAAEAAAQAASTPLSITGINGVQVYGSEEAGFTIAGNADQQILASQIFGP